MPKGDLKVEVIRDGLGIGLQSRLEDFCSGHPNAEIQFASHSFQYLPPSLTESRDNPSREIHYYVIWYREDK